MTNAVPPPRPRPARAAARRPTVTTSSQRGLEAQAPELAHELLASSGARRWSRSATPLARRPQRGHRLRRLAAWARRRPRRSRRGRAGRGRSRRTSGERARRRGLSCPPCVRPRSPPCAGLALAARRVRRRRRQQHLRQQAHGGDGGRGSATAAAARRAGCKTVAAPKPKGQQHLPKPTTKLDPRARATRPCCETNCGTFDDRPGRQDGAEDAASFASLASQGFFDGTDLPPHRPRLRDPGR